MVIEDVIIKHDAVEVILEDLLPRDHSGYVEVELAYRSEGETSVI